MKISNRKIWKFFNYFLLGQYPMLTVFSKKEWQRKEAWGIVFMLHHVTDINPKGILSNEILKISPAFLEHTIIKYRRKGFQFISLDELSDYITSNTYPKHPFVAFTIDDGYLDCYTHAFPLFEKYHVPFCLFLATDFVDKNAILWWESIENLIMSHDKVITSDGSVFPCGTYKERQATFNHLRKRIFKLDQSRLVDELKKMFCNYDIDWLAPIKQSGMTWNQIKELANHPLCTIGGHTVSHPVLNKLNNGDFRKEIRDGIKIIEDKTGKEVLHFAYPYGSSNIIGNREWQLIEEFSFKTAFCSYGGCITTSNHKSVTNLPRIGLYDRKIFFLSQTYRVLDSLRLKTRINEPI